MRQKRLFLAIKLPEELRKKLKAYNRENLDPRIFQVVSDENFHLTILFLGNTAEDRIPLIKKVVSSVVSQISMKNISLKEIDYGPQSHNPHLVWLRGDYNPDLEGLKKQIVKQLIKAGFHLQVRKDRFIPHITLARIREYSPLPLPKREQIKQKLSFTFFPSLLWLIESQLTPPGAKYFDLYKFPIPNA